MRAALVTLAVAVVVATVTFASAARADDATPPAPAPAPEHGVDLKISAGDDDASSALNRMPADARARLTPDQIEHIVRREQEDRQGGAHKLTEVVVPGLFFACIVGIVVAIVFGRQRRDAMLHETLRLMIEKGVDIPPELLVSHKQKPNDRRRGLILACVGVGLTAFLSGVDRQHDGAWALGLVPLLLGVGYLVAFYVERRERAADTLAPRD